MFSFLFTILNFFRIFLILILSFSLYPFIRHKAIYVFLRLCGPSFIKLGQLLSTRPDLIGGDLANALSAFQDKLPEFDYKKAKKIIENSFSKKIDNIFSDFSKKAVASASIAQVHKAKMHDGNVVAVKILRPNIRRLVARDLNSLRLMVFLVGLFSKYHKRKLRDILDLLEGSAQKELDFLTEASVAAQMKENLKDVKGFYIPKIYWDLVSDRVIVMEWIDGVPFSNKKEIKKSEFDKNELAKNLVVSYFTQIYVHGFFHADMHPGNLFLMKNGNIGLIDFGIIGIIDKKTRIGIAQILMAFLNKDYKKVAQIHVDYGLVPKRTNIDEFALTCRVIGQSVVDRSVQQVSLAKLLDRLLKMTRKYDMVTKPELLLLQKAMMLVEGVGVDLDQDLNIWELARPWIKDWAIKNVGFDAKIKDELLDLFDSVKDLPDIIRKIKTKLI